MRAPRRRTVAAYPYHVYLGDKHVVEVKKGGQQIGIYLITPTARRRGVVLPVEAWIALQNSVEVVNLAIGFSQGGLNDGAEERLNQYGYGNRLDSIASQWRPSQQTNNINIEGGGSDYFNELLAYDGSREGQTYTVENSDDKPTEAEPGIGVRDTETDSIINPSDISTTALTPTIGHTSSEHCGGPTIGR